MDNKDDIRSEPPSSETGTSPAAAVAPIPKNLGRRTWNFSVELWNDHSFWLRALAAKGGAATAVVLGVVGISAALSMPFLVATAAIVLCTGFIALGIGGILWGGATAWEKLKETYYKTFSLTPPKEDATAQKPLHQRILEKPSVKKLLKKPLMQKFLKSHTWKTTRSIGRKWENIFLAGMASGGGFISAVSGVAVITTHVLVLSAVTVTSLVTVPTVIAATAVFSGVYGIYLGTESLIDSFRNKKNTNFDVDGKKKKIVWALKNTREILKSDKDLKNKFNRAAAFTGLTAATAGLGMTGAFFAATPALAAGIGAAAIAGVLSFGKKARDSWLVLKNDAIPKLQAGLAERFLKMKSAPLLDAMKGRAAQNKKKKTEEPEKEKTAETAQPAAEKKPAAKTSLSATFGGWVLKKAADKSKKENKEPPPPAAAP